MKIGLYSPYCDTLGGGERYLFTFAEYGLQKGWEVELWWHDGETVALAMQRFHLKLTDLKLNRSMYHRFQADASYASKLVGCIQMPRYDLIFWLSDGSIPYLRGKQNWLHMQVPFQVRGQTYWTQQKLSRIHRVICNSSFTKGFIDASFGIESEVIYPPVATHAFETTVAKEPVILGVGRFDQILNSKRQDVLIQAFKQLVDEGLSGWQLVLVGGQQHNEQALLTLREMSIGYPIEFRVNVSFDELTAWYQKATIYWQATGFAVDAAKEPQRVEHFGITLVEAMAAGCIPIAFEAGGVSEIITDKKTGYGWSTPEQLVRMTYSMIQNLSKEKKTIQRARKRALRFSKETFFQEIEKRLG